MSHPTGEPHPRIGIITVPQGGRTSVATAYASAIEQAGGLPLLLPPAPAPQALFDFAVLIEGLLIPGGDGITEGLVGTLPDDLPPVDPLRWASDTAYYHAMRENGSPILGICYGMQFLNAVHGGTIYADVYAQCPGVLVHTARRGGEPHPIQAEAGTHLAALIGEAPRPANSYHIQAVAEVGAGLRVNARSADGVIEGIESDDGLLLGLQCHPERMIDDPAWLGVFAAFVRQCGASAAANRGGSGEDDR